MKRTLITLSLVLLAGSVFGFGQQPPASRLESLVAEAQQAQAAHDYAAAEKAYKQALRIEPSMPELWANLGLMQQEAGDIASAIPSFQQANHLNPSLYVPNLFLGNDYVRTGKAPEAIPFLTIAEKANQTDPQAPFALGRAYYATGKFPAAAQEFERAVALDPKLGAAWFALGIARLSQVEKDAREISERAKSSSFAGALYAASLQKQGRFGEAASLYKSLRNAYPQPPCLGSELGFSLFRGHDGAGAKETFTTESTQHPECSLALLGKVRVAMEDGDKQQAVALLQDLWSRDHGFVESNSGLLLDGVSGGKTPAIEDLLESAEGGRIPPDLRRALLNSSGLVESGSLLSQSDMPMPSTRDSLSSKNGNPEAAFRSGHYSDCARQLSPAFARLTSQQLSLLAACAQFTGDERLVERTAAEMRKMDPRSFEALYWSVQANERLALESLARFQQLDSDSATSHVLLGDIYHQLDRNDDAQTEYLKALDIAPGDPAAMLGAATAYLSNNNLPAAEQAAQSALSARPNDPDMNLIMAEVELGRHEYSAAEPYLEKSLQTKPDGIPRVHALLGKVYAETDRPQQAIKELELGASSDDDGSIQYQLSRLYRQLGDTKQAKVALDRMKAIRDKRRERGYKFVQDPELSAMEPQSGQPSAP